MTNKVLEEATEALFSENIVQFKALIDRALYAKVHDVMEEARVNLGIKVMNESGPEDQEDSDEDDSSEEDNIYFDDDDDLTYDLTTDLEEIEDLDEAVKESPSLNAAANKLHDALGSAKNGRPFDHEPPTGRRMHPEGSGFARGYKYDKSHTFTKNKAISSDEFSKHAENAKSALGINKDDKGESHPALDKESRVHSVPGTSHALIINHGKKSFELTSKRSLKTKE